VGSLRVLVTLAVVLLLHTILLPYVFGDSRPDLFLILVVFLSLGQPLERSYLPCWLTGLLKDVFSGVGQVGAFAALYLALAVVISQVRRQLFVEHIATQLLVVGAASLVSQGLWLLVWFHSPGFGWRSALWRLAGGTCLTVLVAPLALGLFRLLGWRLR